MSIRGSAQPRPAALIALAALILTAGLGACTGNGTKTREASYQFAVLKRSSLESKVSSTGTLSPVSEVSVLAQMSGRVERVGADYNDRVRRGQVLVTLNTDMLRLEEKESEAAVSKAQAAYDLQALDLRNKEELARKGLVADYDLQSSRASLQGCAAELASSAAALKVIRTQLEQYARITSPIDGIVLDRNVDVGQMVVEGSSANASSLFTLAEDLSRMEIKAEVDELDIGSIRVGQEVRFTVEAISGRSFSGKVHEIRLVPVTTDNVVKYYVMIDADNKDGRLLPGMTAEVEFVVSKRADVLSVPNAALRFEPAGLSAAQIQEAVFEASLAGLGKEEREAALAAKAEAAKSQAGSASGTASGTASGAATSRRGLGSLVMMGPGGPGGTRAGQDANGAAGAEAAAGGPTKKTLWYLDEGGKLAVLLVQTGVSDGASTELVDAEGLEGRSVIVKAAVN